MDSGQKIMSYPTLNPKWIKLTSLERLYKVSIPILGLTGGIATGKSSFAKLLKDKGVLVIDADALIKKIYQRDDVFRFIQTHVPLAIENHKINFKHLREHVFGHADLKAELEQFLYSHMPVAFQDELNLHPEATWLVYDVPLLFERSLNFIVDSSIVVYANPETQVERLMKRDNISEDFARNILTHQMPIDEKKNLADYVVDNSGDLNDHPEILLKLWKDLVS